MEGEGDERVKLMISLIHTINSLSESFQSGYEGSKEKGFRS